jgi:hypothetical protein
VRNQCHKAPKEAHQLQPDGFGLDCSAYPSGSIARVTLRLADVVSWEATAKACGVAVAKLQGQSWAPILSNGLNVNVGTILIAPSRVRRSEGKTHRRLMPSRRDGGPVVVSGRESRLHGEGVQCARGFIADEGGRQ